MPLTSTRKGAPTSIDAVADILVSALPDGAALHEPVFGGREWDYVKDCLDTAWVSSVGGYIDRFEQMLRDRMECGDAIATVNGTAALHVLLEALGIGDGDEVVIPALTFVATANAVAHAGATPHFADIDPATLGLDPKRLADHLADTAERRDGALVNRHTGRRIRAVVAVHVFGHPCDIDGLTGVAEAFGIDLIEDAAESLGSTYRGRPTGALGRAGTLSFNGNKTVTTGGGGAVLTNDPELGKRLRHLSTTAKAPHAWAYFHDAVGFNYRMPNINAALGCAQLEQLDDFLDVKRRLAGWYRDRLADLPRVAFVDEPAGTQSNFWLNAILLDDSAARDALLKACNDQEIGLRPAWDPMHRLPMFASCPRAALDATEDICARLVNLPSGVGAARAILAEAGS